MRVREAAGGGRVVEVSPEGGSSSGRFARRREGQARLALDAAADAVARVLLLERLDALVLGGDAAALAALHADPRLSALLSGAEPRILDVPEPRRAAPCSTTPLAGHWPSRSPSASPRIRRCTSS